jgi:hypothetical protein
MPNLPDNPQNAFNGCIETPEPLSRKSKTIVSVGNNDFSFVEAKPSIKQTNGPDSIPFQYHRKSTQKIDL